MGELDNLHQPVLVLGRAGTEKIAEVGDHVPMMSPYRVVNEVASRR